MRLSKVSSPYSHILLAVHIFIPVIFFLPLSDPFSSAKIFVLKIAAGLLLAQSVLIGRIPLPGRKLGYMMISVMGLSLIAALNCENRYLSFYGIYPFYSNSFFTFAYYSLLFLYSSASSEDSRKIISFAVHVSLIVSVYGILQFAGLDPVNWTENVAHGRVWSTFGNPNFLSSYLAVIIPYIIVMISENNTLYYRMNLVLAVTALLLTFSRSGLISFSFSAVICILLLKRIGAKVKLRILLAPLLLLLLLLIMKPGSLSSMKRYLDLSGHNMSSRLEQYKAAAVMIKERPVSGWGINSYYIMFRRYISKDFFLHTDVMSVPGYPHNIVLDTAVKFGIPLSLIIIYIWYLFIKTVYKSKYNNLYAAALGSISAYAISNMSGFSVPGVSAVFWSLLALSSSAAFPDIRTIKLPWKNIRYAVIALPLLMMFKAYKGFKADMKFNSGDYISAFELEPDNLTYMLGLGKKYFIEGDLKESEDMFRIAAEKYPSSALAFNALGRIALKRNDANTAENYFSEAVKRDPYLIDSNRRLAAIYASGNRLEEAENIYLKMISISPEMAAARIGLVKVYILQGKASLAEKECRRVLETDPENREALSLLGRISALRN